MESWEYNGNTYTTIHPSEEDDGFESLLEIYRKTKGLIMHTKSKRLYNLVMYGYSGNGSRLKLYCQDIQTKKEYFFSYCNMDLVIKQ